MLHPLKESCENQNLVGSKEFINARNLVGKLQINMTIAICIQCGHEKVGAISPCPNCGLLPATPEEQAKSITLSDRNHNPEELRQIATRIQAGESFAYDNNAVTQMAIEIDRLGDFQMPLGCRIAVWIPIFVMFTMITLLIAIFIHTNFF